MLKNQIRAPLAPLATCLRRIPHARLAYRLYSTKDTDDLPSVPESDSIPWYMRDNAASELAPKLEDPLPEIPTNAPPSMQKILDIMSKDLGLVEIRIIDVKDEKDSSAFEFMIISSGKSERHVYKAANELRIKMKHEFDTIPKLEGFISNAARNAAHRRILRRARKGPMSTDRDFGKPANSWVLCDPGFDGLCIHILTKERRQELDLESLWLGLETNEAPSMESITTNTPTFQSKRQFHTSTRFWQSTNTVMRRFLAEPQDISAKRISEYVQEMNSINPITYDDFQKKFSFYKTIHLINPELINFNQVEDCLLDKYRSLQYMMDLPSKKFSEAKSKDTVEYMKLLIDSPHFNGLDIEEAKLISDIYLDKLSQFLAKLYKFSNDNINLNAGDIGPLLLRLSYYSNEESFVGPGTIDNFLQTKKFPVISNNNCQVSKSRLRGLLDLLKHVNCLPSNELILHMYGNAADLDNFWDYWNTNFDVFAQDTQQAWLRLVVYLAIIKDSKASYSFLSRFFDGSSTMGNFKNNVDPNKLTNEEKQILKACFPRIIDSIVGDVKFANVRAYMAQLN